MKQTTTWRAVNDYGIGWLASRFAYEMQVRSGLTALRFPQRPWAENELSRWISPGIPSQPQDYASYWQENRRPFLFQPSNRSSFAITLPQILGDRRVSLKDSANRIVQGEFCYFSSQYGELGPEPDWHYNPFTGQRTPKTAHWTRIPMYSPETGDLKFIWEPGRFASAYTLARAYWATGDEAYPETFWRLVESWEQANPPNQGAHWKCGQETSLRIMAWCFALYAFADSPATTPARLAELVGMIAAQADRVSGDHKYSRLQRNNHSISEGVGLWTVGLLFPEIRLASQWLKEGRQILADEASSQIAGDGSYIQNSTNYHRLMLHDFIWALRLGELCADPLPNSVAEQVERAVRFLYQVQDDESGQAPCYGPNDGALILPLNECDYQDFRPVLAAGFYLTHRRRVYDRGPWDEDLLWLFGENAIESSIESIPRESLAANNGGYYTLRGGRAFALTRCVDYSYRPAQADMLHVDLWWNGVNVALDPGSYRYFCESPWNNGLIGTSVHNTVTIDDEDQMTRGPRFMWFDWTAAEVRFRQRSTGGALECFEGQHSGYSRLDSPVEHRRALIRAGDDIWVVVDDLLGVDSHGVQAQWLLQPGEHVLDQLQKRLRLKMSGAALSLYWNVWNVENASVDLSCGDEDAVPRGWRSHYYGIREPALSLKLAGRGQMPCRIAWVFVLGEHIEPRVSLEGETIEVNLSDSAQTLSLTLYGVDSGRQTSLRDASFSHHSDFQTLGVQ